MGGGGGTTLTLQDKKDEMDRAEYTTGRGHTLNKVKTEKGFAQCCHIQAIEFK